MFGELELLRLGMGAQTCMCCSAFGHCRWASLQTLAEWQRSLEGRRCFGVLLLFLFTFLEQRNFALILQPFSDDFINEN